MIVVCLDEVQLLMDEHIYMFCRLLDNFKGEIADAIQFGRIVFPILSGTSDGFHGESLVRGCTAREIHVKLSPLTAENVGEIIVSLEGEELSELDVTYVKRLRAFSNGIPSHIFVSFLQRLSIDPMATATPVAWHFGHSSAMCTRTWRNLKLSFGL
eukprot:gb/GECG01005184.1/.p1 GENE.gb/GECG01005184.1/~~gb/GECG01005184.1/.p1  ORF type:complete len:156 (+),score=14.56 gb/GECG01005184.1/:1-468(+)